MKKIKMINIDKAKMAFKEYLVKQITVSSQY